MLNFRNENIFKNKSYNTKKENVDKKNGSLKKLAIISGVALAGVGATIGTKIYIKRKKFVEFNKEKVSNKSNEYNEMKMKIKEFNSSRITTDNTPHADSEEMLKYVESEKEPKISLDTSIYKEGKYDKYDIYEDELNK